jgi:hypothetical protein
MKRIIRFFYDNMWQCPKCKAWNPDSSNNCLNCE